VPSFFSSLKGILKRAASGCAYIKIHPFEFNRALVANRTGRMSTFGDDVLPESSAALGHLQAF